MCKILTVKDRLLDLEKYFIELEDRELKNREVLIKRKIEELLLKPIILSIDEMSEFEEKEMRKISSS